MKPLKMLTTAFALTAALFVAGCEKAAETTTPAPETTAPSSDLGESAGTPEEMAKESEGEKTDGPAIPDPNATDAPEAGSNP